MYTFVGTLTPLNRLAMELSFQVTSAVAKWESTSAFTDSPAARVIAAAKLVFDRCDPDMDGRRPYVKRPVDSGGRPAASRMVWGDVVDRLAKRHRDQIVCPECDSILVPAADGLVTCISCGFSVSCPTQLFLGTLEDGIQAWGAYIDGMEAPAGSKRDGVKHVVGVCERCGSEVVQRPLGQICYSCDHVQGPVGTGRDGADGVLRAPTYNAQHENNPATGGMPVGKCMWCHGLVVYQEDGIFRCKACGALLGPKGFKPIT